MRMSEFLSGAKLASIVFVLSIFVPQIAIAADGGSALPDARVGSAYYFAVAHEGMIEPVTYSWDGELPPGLKGDGARLRGIPTAARVTPYRFTVTVRPAQGETQALECSMRVRPERSELAIVPSKVPPIVAGDPVHLEFALAGAEGRVAWEIAPGTLPRGLVKRVDPNSGLLVIEGKAELAGQFIVRLSATDFERRTSLDGFSLEVRAPPIPLGIDAASLAVEATSGSLARHFFRATGGTPPYNWSLTSSEPQMTKWKFDSAAGTLSGSSTIVGRWSGQLRVTDSLGGTAGPMPIVVTVAPPTILPSLAFFPEKLPEAVPGQNYGAFLFLGGVRGRPTIKILRCPPWLTAEPTGSVVSLRGTVPDSDGPWRIEVSAADGDDSSPDSLGRVTPRSWDIIAHAPAPLAITTRSLPPALADQPYELQIAWTGPATQPEFVASSGFDGKLRLMPDGRIRTDGVPVGDYPLGIVLRDRANTRREARAEVTLKALPPSIVPLLAFFPGKLPEAVPGQNYEAFLFLGGVRGRPTIKVLRCPPWLTAESTDSVLSLRGTVPDSNGPWRIEVSATDGDGLSPDSLGRIVPRGWDIIARPLPPLAITTKSLPSALADRPYDLQIAWTGPATRPEFVASSGFDGKLRLLTDGRISTAGVSAGDYPLNIVLLDRANAARETRVELMLRVIAVPASVETLDRSTRNQPIPGK